jgi:hypothetical protein
MFSKKKAHTIPQSFKRIEAKGLNQVTGGTSFWDIFRNPPPPPPPPHGGSVGGDTDIHGG